MIQGENYAAVLRVVCVAGMLTTWMGFASVAPGISISIFMLADAFNKVFLFYNRQSTLFAG